MSGPGSHTDLLPCMKCGDCALISAAVATAPISPKPWIAGYYGHCMNGDCGQQGPTVADEGQARMYWNAQQEAHVSDSQETLQK